LKHRYDFLQVHDAEPLNAWEQQCIYRLKNLMVLGDTYTMLAIPVLPTRTETVNYSDRVRAEWLATHPNGFYVDTDCYMEQRFAPKMPNRVCLPISSNPYDLDSPDIFMVVVNGDADWIKRNLAPEVREQWIQQHVQPSAQKMFYGIPLALRREWKEFQVIPSEIYQHKFVTMRREHEARAKKGVAVVSNAGRHINDVVNEKIVTFDKAAVELKTFLEALRDMFNKQCDRVAELEKTVKELSTKNKETKAENELPR